MCDKLIRTGDNDIATSFVSSCMNPKHTQRQSMDISSWYALSGTCADDVKHESSRQLRDLLSS